MARPRFAEELTPVTIACRILRSSADIEDIAADWQALEQHCADPLGYFQSYDWCSAWARQFAAKGTQPFVVTLWSGELLLLVCPLMIVQAAGLARLETLGTPHTQYCGLLVRDGASLHGDIAAALRAAVAQSRADVWLQRAVLAGSELSRLLGDMPQNGSDNAASMLELGGYVSAEDYTARLGKLQKRNRNRRRNHLARIGDLDFAVVWPDDADFAPLVAQCADMKRRWLTETGRYSTGFSMHGYEAFLASLGGDGEALSGACLFVLRAGNDVVAMELGFIHNRHYYAYIGGFDWDLRDLSPGKVQMEMTVGWLINHGIAAYDLLINPADYKASWTNKTVAVSTRAQPLSWKGRWYATTWLPRLRPAIKQAHGALPELATRASFVARGACCLLLYV